jgi:prepilin peptidase CpaA
VPYHLSLSLALAVALAAAVTDWKTGAIPDRLTLGALAAAPVAHTLGSYVGDPSVESAVRGFAASILGAAAAGVLPWLLLRAGGMSGGDVKLFSALGAITGPGFAVHAVTYALVVALVQGLAVVVRRGAVRSTLRNVRALVSRPIVRRGNTENTPPPAMTTMRLAFSIFLGSCMAAAVLWNRSS